MRDNSVSHGLPRVGLRLLNPVLTSEASYSQGPQAICISVAGGYRLRDPHLGDPFLTVGFKIHWNFPDIRKVLYLR